MKLLITLALLLSLATPVAADTIQVIGGEASGVKLIINHTKNDSTLIIGDTEDTQVLIVTGEDD